MLYLSKRKSIFKINSNQLLACSLGLAYLVIIILSGILNAAQLENNPNNRTKCIITFENDIKLETNDSLIYLGRTKNYLIIYNLNSQMNTVIKIENIKDLKIKNRSLW